MAAAWPSVEARERYLEFLQYELRLVTAAALGEADMDHVWRFSAFLREYFPRTNEFILRKAERDPQRAFSDEVRMVAWAEARSVQEGGGAGVKGEWTAGEISDDINECFTEARRREGL